MQIFVEQSTGIHHHVIEISGPPRTLQIELRDAAGGLRAVVNLDGGPTNAECRLSFSRASGAPRALGDPNALWLLGVLACRKLLSWGLNRVRLFVLTDAAWAYRRIGLHHTPGHTTTLNAFRALHRGGHPQYAAPEMLIDRHLNPAWLARFGKLLDTSWTGGYLECCAVDMLEGLSPRMRETWIELDTRSLPPKKRPWTGP